jgi:type VI secretion system protein ImpF
MARVDALSITPSLLDRLLDDTPSVSQEPAGNRFQNISQLKGSVARDLEAMLNTRQETLEELPPEFTELNQALLAYGLPDFTSLNLRDRRDRNRILRVLERAISAFEPRLKNVRVVLENPRENDRALRFRVEAVLQVKPAAEPVSFDAVLRLNTQEYVVQGRA